MASLDGRGVLQRHSISTKHTQYGRHVDSSQMRSGLWSGGVTVTTMCAGNNLQWLARQAQWCNRLWQLAKVNTYR
jgi:hypothetical protein